VDERILMGCMHSLYIACDDLGALPPVLLRAVCLVRAMLDLSGKGRGHFLCRSLLLMRGSVWDCAGMGG